MKIIATIRFLDQKERCGDWRPRSGIRPQLKVKELFTSCIVWGNKDDQVFEPEIEHIVRLELLHWEQYKNDIYLGMPVQLNDGSRIVAMGKITEMHD